MVNSPNPFAIFPIDKKFHPSEFIFGILFEKQKLLFMTTTLYLGLVFNSKIQ
jgi:hypothetical protein